MNARKGFSSRWQVVLSAANQERNPEAAELCEQTGSLKPIMLLTTLLFLLVAPAPDSRDIAEMSANFLIVKNPQALMAAEEPTKPEEEKVPEYYRDR
jgi:hypothetical protein